MVTWAARGHKVTTGHMTGQVLCKIRGVLNGDARPDRVWFSVGFCLERGIDFINFLNRVSLHDLMSSLFETSPQAEFLLVCQCTAYYNKKQSVASPF